MRAALLLALAILAGCAAPAPGPGTSSGAGWTPSPGIGDAESHFGFPDPVTGMQPLGNGEPNGTTGFWIEEKRDLAYLSGGVGLRIIGLADPANPVVVAKEVENTEGTRDVEVFEHPDGNTYAVMVQAGQSRAILVDVTDASSPVVVSNVTLPGTHTIAVVPNSTVVYNSRSISAHVPGLGETGQIDIIDFADPRNPTVKVFVFPAVVVTEGGVPRAVLSTTCHEMTFNAELKRAYCAGVTDTTIWDTTDPLNPVIRQVIDWPGNNIHHGVYDARGGDLLLITDEWAGVAAPSPPCSEAFRNPTSSIWFFDISDLATPLPVGYFQVAYEQLGGEAPTGVPAYCSTHLGDVVDGHDLFVLGWYAGGTVLVDFSSPANAVQVDAWHAPAPTSVWEARYHDGHIYAADTQRGLDILKLV